MASLYPPISMLAGRVPQRRNLTEEEKKSIQSVFYCCDKQHEGYLSREDLKVAVVALFGYKPSKHEVNDIIGPTAASRRPQRITLECFIDEMTKKILNKDEDEEIRQIFLAFDSQCRGFLMKEDLKRVFRVVTPHLSNYNIEEAFREIDRDGDGRVSYKDFEFMMKFNTFDGF